MAEVNKRQEATLRDFLNVVFRRKWTILSILILTTASLFFVSASKPVTYISSSRVLVKRGETPSVFGSPRYLTWAEEVSSEIEVILSKPVFERAAEIFADSVAARGQTDIYFQPGTVRADVVGESNVFVIRSTGLNPAECQLSCEAVTLAYKEYYEKTAAPPQVQDFFSEEIRDVATEIDHWRVKKTEFLNRTKFLGLDDEGRFAMNKRTNVELKLADVRSDVSQSTVRVAALRRMTMLSPDELEKQLAVSEASHVLQSALLQNIKFSLQNYRMKREELLNRYTPRHPEVVATDAQIKELQQSLKQEVENVYNIEESRLSQLIAKQKSLEEDLAATNQRLAEIPDQEMELDRIESQIHRLEGEHQLLLRKQNEAEIAIASSPEWEVTILTPAGPATSRKTTDYVRLALGPLLALIVGLGFAFFLEGLDHSLKNVGEVEEYLGANVLATVSDIREKVS